MSTTLTTARHLEGLRVAMLAFTRYAAEAGLSTPVPTCPDWTVRDLIAHQGMVHRWSTASVRGEVLGSEAIEALESEGRVAADPVEWLGDGAIELAQALYEAPDDLEAPVFLHDPPAPRAFWARRQCHETTIHAVDAQAAALGRAVTPAEAGWITDDIALDGIDELLTGFLPRRKSRLRVDPPGTLLVRAGDRSWSVRLSPEPPVTEQGAVGDATWMLSSAPVEAYLRLWNRAAQPIADPDWTLAAVTW